MNRLRDALVDAFQGLPALLRHAVVGAAALGLPGAAVGFVLGLRAYVPTAWAAALEVGVPAAVLGGVLGLTVGLLAHLRQRSRSGSRP